MAVWRHVKCHRLLPRSITLEGQTDGSAAHSKTPEGRHYPQEQGAKPAAGDVQYEGTGGNTPFGQRGGGNKAVLWLANQQLGTHEIGTRDAAIGTAASAQVGSDGARCALGAQWQEHHNRIDIAHTTYSMRKLTYHK